MMKTAATSPGLAVAARGRELQPVPAWVWSPLATEALIEALHACDEPEELRGEMLPLRVPGETSVAGMLARMRVSERVVHERPFPAHPWCLREWIASALADPVAGDDGQECGLAVVEDGAGPLPSFALPPVEERPLAPLLAEASRYGAPGQWCPAVLEGSAWQEVVNVFRDAQPDEAMLVLRGSLCICRDSERAYTHVTRADRIAAEASAEVVTAAAQQVVDALVRGTGQFVALAHSHPVAARQGTVAVSTVDLETLRKNLRWAGAFSLIANVPADGGEPEPVAVGWSQGAPVCRGFYVTGR